MSEGLLSTPDGFVWLFSRDTLAALPTEEQQQWREFHDEVWEAMLYDQDVHDGCAPADELHRVQRERDDAFRLGYVAACSDIEERVEKMEAATPGDGFGDAKRRMKVGIARLRERGPKDGET